jgi:hypothetical protein
MGFIKFTDSACAVQTSVTPRSWHIRVSKKALLIQQEKPILHLAGQELHKGMDV